MLHVLSKDTEPYFDLVVCSDGCSYIKVSASCIEVQCAKGQRLFVVEGPDVCLSLRRLICLPGLLKMPGIATRTQTGRS